MGFNSGFKGLNSVAGSARGWTTLTCTTLCLEQKACTSRVTQLCC